MRNDRLKPLTFFLFTMLLSLACVLTPRNKQSNTDDPAEQAPLASSSVDQPADDALLGDQQVKPAGFSESDCSMSGVTFNPISYGNTVDDIYDGPNLTCSYSSTGAHGLSETNYIRIVAYKADQLEGFYSDLKENINGYIVQSNEWNAHPDLPADAKNEITMIRDDADGYVFMITKNANVQGCTKGDGYGVEKVAGKYLVQILFSSCEGTAPSYLTTIKYMQSIAAEAIARLEASPQP
jgi:hypothetical protein